MQNPPTFNESLFDEINSRYAEMADMARLYHKMIASNEDFCSSVYQTLECIEDVENIILERLEEYHETDDHAYIAERHQDGLRYFFPHRICTRCNCVPDTTDLMIDGECGICREVGFDKGVKND